MSDLVQAMLILWAVIAGTLVVIVLEWPIDYLMEKVHKGVELPKVAGMSQSQWKILNERIPGGKRIGRLERAFFFVAFSIGAPELVAVWLAFKVASKWETWSNIY